MATSFQLYMDEHKRAQTAAENRKSRVECVFFSGSRQQKKKIDPSYPESRPTEPRTKIEDDAAASCVPYIYTCKLHNKQE